MLKIGLIQPEPTPGHFPGNLRTIVELYRFCLDAGAELVLCPPLALSGAHTGELALRSGFRTQHLAALAYLAREITHVPLLLGAVNREGIRFHIFRDGRSFPQPAVIPPHSHGQESVPLFGVWKTEDEAGFSIASYDDTRELCVSSPCFLLRTPDNAWHEGVLEQDEEKARRTARKTGLPVFTARLAGGEGSFLLSGASSAWSDNGILLNRLRLFERDFSVISLDHSKEADSFLPSSREQIQHAIQKGMKDLILKSGHNSVCLNLLENSASLLLAKLLREALPAQAVTGFIPQLPESTEGDKDKAQALADTAGINVRMISSSIKSSERLDEKLTIAWLMRQWAEEEGAVMISSLTGTDILTEPRLLPTALATDFMPLGDLYETELAELFPGIISPSPDATTRDGFLIRLQRFHESATDLANQFPESEQKIRRLQRQIRSSEWIRGKLPPRLILRSIPGTQETPFIHQLSD